VTERPWVLIAEDSSTVRLKLEQMVEALGFEPILAADGAAAIQSFDEVHPSIVLLDINMPEVDGLEVCRHIRAASPETGIIIITADSRPEIVREAIEAGANDFVTKPFTSERLKAALDRRLKAA
jgi:CheY-like chemotaxis protein